MYLFYPKFSYVVHEYLQSEIDPLIRDDMQQSRTGWRNLFLIKARLAKESVSHSIEGNWFRLYVKIKSDILCFCLSFNVKSCTVAEGSQHGKMTD